MKKALAQNEVDRVLFVQCDLFIRLNICTVVKILNLCILKCLRSV